MQIVVHKLHLVLDILRVFHVKVSKLYLNFSMLQTLIFNIADAE
jgi:hypothetical protein